MKIQTLALLTHKIVRKYESPYILNVKFAANMCIQKNCTYNIVFTVTIREQIVFRIVN
jgi:hypothetical protein